MCCYKFRFYHFRKAIWGIFIFVKPFLFPRTLLAKHRSELDMRSSLCPLVVILDYLHKLLPGPVLAAGNLVMTRPVSRGNRRLLRDLVSVGRGRRCDLVCAWVAPVPREML